MMPSTKIAQMVQLHRTKGAARAVDKKCLLMTFPPEPQVQIQNIFTELILIMPSTKIAQMSRSAEQKGRQSSR